MRAAVCEGRGRQRVVDGVAGSDYEPNLDRTFALEQIVEAHRYMGADQAVGKVVGLTNPTNSRRTPSST